VTLVPPSVEYCVQTPHAMYPRRVAHQFHVNGIPSYLYQFSMPLDNWPKYEALGNYHSSELSLVFDNEQNKFNEKEKTLSLSFQSYWTSMAKHGHPNGNLSTEQAFWLPYDFPCHTLMLHSCCKCVGIACPHLHAALY
jgi:carboxylesterase type B